MPADAIPSMLQSYLDELVPDRAPELQIAGIDPHAEVTIDAILAAYPATRGTPELRRAITDWLGRRFGLVLCTFNTLLHLYTRRDVERF